MEVNSKPDSDPKQAERSADNRTTTARPLVLMVHGLAAHRIVFAYLQWHLRRQGLKSKTWGYRSVWNTIERHAQRLEKKLRQLDDDPRWSEIHLVCHSMGGIVARQALLNFVPNKFGRLVMMASPNHGSSAARFLANYVFPFSKTLRQISDEPGSYVRKLGFPENIDVGVIFANVDRVIKLESAIPIEGVPVATIYSGHNDLLVRPTTARQVTSFVKHGRFED